MTSRGWLFGSACLVIACGDPRSSGDGETGPSAVSAAGSSESAGENGADDGDDAGAEEGAATQRLDTPPDDTDDPATCEIVGDLDAIGECEDQAPPDSFELATQWSWDGEGTFDQSVSIPLVANLTDDNGDGSIDPCDTPDILVQVFDSEFDGMTTGRRRPGRLYALDGATGEVVWLAEDTIGGLVTPAVGDIDGDGMVEIVTTSQPATPMSVAHLRVFEHDGTVKWTATEPLSQIDGGTGGIALADVDNDGDVEIALGGTLWDHDGNLLQTFDDTLSFFAHAVVFADLDGDDDMEVVLGRSAFHHDGTRDFQVGSLREGIPQIANLDGDPDPEIVVINPNGLSVLEHDGQVTLSEVRPFPARIGNREWLRPASIHDIDGDGTPEILVSVRDNFAAYRPDLSVVWSTPIQDNSGAATATAFDFLGDGTAEAMYGDEVQFFVYDETGTALLQAPRSSATQIEYPVVADVDNDGSAEIVVVSERFQMQKTAPMIQVFRDVDDRWIQARRIWNQHTYHVTNIREDGTIPQVEPKHWQSLNTFRTNAQIENGGTCSPTPVG